jgi:hypothetical protein
MWERSSSLFLLLLTLLREQGTKSRRTGREWRVDFGEAGAAHAEPAELAVARAEFMIRTRKAAKPFLRSENIIMKVHRKIVLLHREIAVLPVIQGCRSRYACGEHSGLYRSGGV